MVWTRSPPAKKQRAAIMSAVGFSVTKTTMPLDSTKRSLIRCDIVSDKFSSPTYKKQTLGIVTRDTFIPKYKMAMPFCTFKTLAGFGFQFTKVSSHFCELVLPRFALKPKSRDFLKVLLCNTFKKSLVARIRDDNHNP
jgi:hypothetical protein